MTNQSSNETAALRQAMAGEFLNLHELVAKARANLNKNNWDYIVGGTETETTMLRNRLALDTIALRPRVLRDVGNIDASVEFLGRSCGCRSCSVRSAPWRRLIRAAAQRSCGRRMNSASRIC
jgi:hypothetical protein